MNVLYGVQNFLQFIESNWTLITVIVGLLLSILKKVQSYMNKSDEEKIAIAKKQIKESMLKLVTEAELTYAEWQKAGSIKRAQVIEDIFLTYPILSKVTNQEELIAWLDEVINESLETMRNVIEKQNVK